MRTGFIGGGVMGEALLKNLIGRSISKANDITVSDVSGARRDYLHKTYAVHCVKSNLEAVKNADVIILAVKPQDAARVMQEIKNKLNPGQLAISIMAGITLDSLTKGLAHGKIVRCMPNMPAQIGEGITTWVAATAVTAAQKKLAGKILSAMGEEIMLGYEKYMDMATAISGCGPAYIYLFIETLIDAGVHIGLTRAMAEKLAVESTIGSARSIKVLQKHPAELRNMVTSPGGITAEGLLQLESGGLRSLLLKAVIAAYEKANKMGSK
ncbi:MAG TPA: pyrroline-5-carboxylate reductase [Dehalococcoidia bacterium]|nr:pyrroline-5-carboxylate reductase [Dehalococcoidia bacterium]